MPFVQDEKLPADVEQFFGEYRATFRSEHQQIVAHLFAERGWLVAHVSLPSGLKPEDVTDSYLSELRQYAEGEGFGKKFRIVYAG